MAVIAMTREMGTLGKDVAAGLAERLGLTVVHHELVEHVAERAGMRESEVHRFLEGESSLFDRWTIDSKRLSRYTAEEVLELALRGNVVIRGWGATYLLRSVPHVICVRICAPMSFREEVLKQRLRVKDDLAAIQREIEGNDAARARRSATAWCITHAEHADTWRLRQAVFGDGWFGTRLADHTSAPRSSNFNR